jgi:hypothetical protein
MGVFFFSCAHLLLLRVNRIARNVTEDSFVRDVRNATR